MIKPNPGQIKYDLFLMKIIKIYSSTDHYKYEKLTVYDISLSYTIYALLMYIICNFLCNI